MIMYIPIRRICQRQAMSRFRNGFRVVGILFFASFMLTLMVTNHSRRMRKETVSITVNEEAVRNVLVQGSSKFQKGGADTVGQDGGGDGRVGSIKGESDTGQEGEIGAIQKQEQQNDDKVKDRKGDQVKDINGKYMDKNADRIRNDSRVIVDKPVLDKGAGGGDGGLHDDNKADPPVLDKGANNDILPHWKDPYWCKIDCKTGVPCEYKDEVDFRIILIVANRPDSLQKCFLKAANLDMMNDRLSIDIWIDMSPKDGTIHAETLRMAESLAANFKKGRACVHSQDHHAYIATQWIDTYRPKKDTKEVAIILEDDIDLSVYAWRWYKALHEHFRNADYIAGYSLKSENKQFRSTVGKMKNKAIAGPKSDTIVLYHCFQAWGYSPQPNVWRDFQDWYHTVRKDKGPHDKKNKIDSIEPKIYGSLHTSWWYSMKKNNFQESMAHEMFNIYYTHKVSEKPLYTVYQNLNVYTGKDIRLCSNRKEKGLHYGGGANINTTSVLLNYWDESFIQFPEHPKRFQITGDEVEY